MSRKVSLKDIAREAGVSIALVSYVLNNLKEGRIRKEVAQRVREVAQRLNYRPNHLARSLKTRKTMTIGLVVADISNPFSSTLARIIEDEAEKKNYTVIFGSSDENSAKCSKLIETFVDRQVDGLILSPPSGAGEQVAQLVEQKIPLVLLDRYFTGIETNCVMIDNLQATQKGVEYLVNQGKTRIAYMGYDSSMLHLVEREAGYRRAVEAHSLPLSEALIKRVSIANEKNEILKALDEVLNLDVRPDGLLFSSNMIASICLETINRLPLRVPDDLSLVCFDETSSLQLFYAPLAFIRQPLQAMGEAAAAILINAINGITQFEKRIFQAELVIRH